MHLIYTIVRKKRRLIACLFSFVTRVIFTYFFSLSQRLFPLILSPAPFRFSLGAGAMFFVTCVAARVGHPLFSAEPSLRLPVRHRAMPKSDLVKKKLHCFNSCLSLPAARLSSLFSSETLHFLFIYSLSYSSIFMVTSFIFVGDGVLVTCAGLWTPPPLSSCPSPV
jgi:hypothetical protein